MRLSLRRVLKIIPRTRKQPARDRGSTHQFTPEVVQEFVPTRPPSQSSRTNPAFRMAFDVIRKDSHSHARSGRLELRGPLPEIETTNGNGAGLTNDGCHTFQTPMFFIHTVAGSIPHITSEVLDIVLPTDRRPPVQISMDSIYTVIDCIGPSKMGLSKFVGLPSSPTMLTVSNPLTALPPNFNDKHGISIWSRIGRETLTIAKFNKIIEELKPNSYQLMSDYDVASDSSRKRLKKSTERNVDYMKKTFETIQLSQSSGSAYVTIEFNWFLVDPAEASKAVATILESRDQITGFIINGVSEHIEKEDAFQTLSTIISQLPQDKPRFVPGPFSLSSIVELVKLGVDQFDSSYITQFTEKGQALNLSFKSVLHETGIPIETLIVTDDQTPAANENEEKRTLVRDLNDKMYFEDFRPLSEECPCYTCRKYTRSYIHHLLVTEELLARVLLMGHNLFNFDRFFKAIRETLDTSANLNSLVVTVT